jgi:acetoin utilization deacetylase AcuC-like enzyme
MLPSTAAMRLRVHTTDHHVVPLPPGHRFPSGKYGLLKDRLAARPELELIPVEPIARELIELVHDRDYVRAIYDGTIDERAIRKIGFPWSEGMVRRAGASTHGTLCAARDALELGIGANLAGGTHHAFRDHGAGYCVWNDLAVAAVTLLEEGRVRRVLVVDVDVHQGDGTAAIFAGDDRVFTLSLHGAKNFPFRKERSDLDVELADDTADREYLRALDGALGAAWEKARPELIFLQGGVDGLAEDKLGRLSLTHDGLRARDEKILGMAKARGVPIVLTLGGGYADPISASVAGHAGTYDVACELYAS